MPESTHEGFIGAMPLTPTRAQIYVSGYVEHFSGRSKQMNAPGKRRGMGAINFLSYAGESGRRKFGDYGAAFGDLGSPRGSGRLFVGENKSVIGEGSKWDHIAWIHYPTPLHMAELLDDERYKECEVKHKHGSLSDTVIWCVVEL